MFYLFVFVVGFLVVSLFSFYTLTHPREIEIPYTPEALNLPAEAVSLITDDDVSIAGWHIPSLQSPQRALLLLHGYPANKADLLSLAADLYPDFSLLLIDFRSFGESGGSATTLGIKEPRDVKAALDFLSERYTAIGVFGYSYGGAIALTSASQDDRIDAVASYGSFSSLRGLGHDTYRALWVLKYPLVELMNLYSRIFYGGWAGAVSPADVAKDITVPIFIGHAEGDPLIPVAHARRVISALQEHGNEPETYIVPDISHMGLPIDLDERLRAFFNTYLPHAPEV